MKSWISRVVQLLLVSIGLISCSFRNLTVGEYAQQIKANYEKNLSEKGDFYRGIKARVESAHVTVTVERIVLNKVNVTTLDGSNNAGVEGNNVSTVYLEVTAYWKGFIDRGYTTVGIDIDFQNKCVRNAGIVDTTAMVNTESFDFWADLTSLMMILMEDD